MVPGVCGHKGCPCFVNVSGAGDEAARGPKEEPRRHTRREARTQLPPGDPPGAAPCRAAPRI
ncbi:hypothetical protein Sgou_07550 [Streptomyces gougerotii]|uniref:Uncharacterized protein n=2 Tax=Streptomyces diastaticus group TaxID=2849069 RepID=A0A8H9HUI4_9ACTN|nr:hypothetical protein Srut_29430 [Streptomyces rutgersensis]GFH71718.1 hypothetical protein Sdia_24860 [Streptomyces diastaticus subsp. diastaticus]GFH76085.1 hypothetical protein Sgou_07550 [Streptomyces gougerotii]GGU14197.1 hypothetical protein GCM10015534_16410 [Streptomyces diastaticus subsp. diastaticus]GGU86319.1 hypothetical protein GCM10010227_45980 [Streptomyces gougerotii]